MVNNQWILFNRKKGQKDRTLVFSFSLSTYTSIEKDEERKRERERERERERKKLVSRKILCRNHQRVLTDVSRYSLYLAFLSWA